MTRLRPLIPGVLLCLALAVVAFGLGRLEAVAFGRAWLEPLVLAILLGAVVRTGWQPGPRWKPGIDFSAKPLLEVAVLLLGASFSASAVLAVGWPLLLGITGVVAFAIPASYGLCRAFGLPARMALLVACGNSICGNSAIAAVAPVIQADGRDVAASIAFTAVIGVAVVLLLPLLVPLLGLSQGQYGLLAGLTVYAVPQVLAATAPVGALSLQVGTLVKLVRVLMLGPVVVALSLMAPRLGTANPGGRQPLSRLVPWFILGFLALAALRSLGWLPEVVAVWAAWLAGVLMIIAMAALGLGVDVRLVARSGGRVTAAGIASLLLLAAVSLALIRILGVA
ncbi:YeiH family protein [Roseomonas xinghualingensis]|uniref:YeiH family protein n=1 Tax=Roseomonas xinghualingensis TaxID=2986475 RepID=UPI0021F0F6E9|nr:putative sulfate exporter family transporter [Roseomonas sp. SXEYE001]